MQSNEKYMSCDGLSVQIALQYIHILSGLNRTGDPKGDFVQPSHWREAPIGGVPL
jgi:hypothetical protein